MHPESTFQLGKDEERRTRVPPTGWKYNGRGSGGLEEGREALRNEASLMYPCSRCSFLVQLNAAERTAKKANRQLRPGDACESQTCAERYSPGRFTNRQLDRIERILRDKGRLIREPKMSRAETRTYMSAVATCHAMEIVLSMI